MIFCRTIGLLIQNYTVFLETNFDLLKKYAELLGNMLLEIWCRTDVLAIQNYSRLITGPMEMDFDILEQFILWTTPVELS